MKPHVSVKAALMALALVLAFFISWELYLRNKGVVADYDDGPELWAHTRSMVYEPANKATVFIGSSRIKYDLDIPNMGSHYAYACHTAVHGWLFAAPFSD